MSLETQDIQALERFIYKSADDIAVSLSRSLERLEERLDASEMRLAMRISEIEERMPRS